MTKSQQLVAFGGLKFFEQILGDLVQLDSSVFRDLCQQITPNVVMIKALAAGYTMQDWQLELAEPPYTIATATTY